MPGGIHHEVRLHADRPFPPEDRLERASGQVRACIDRAFQGHAEPLRRGVQRFLCSVEAQRKSIRQALAAKLAEPIGPLDGAHVVLDQRHLEQLLDPLQPILADEGRAGEWHEVFLEDRFHLILDNLQVHHSKPVKAWLAQHKQEIEV